MTFRSTWLLVLVLALAGCGADQLTEAPEAQTRPTTSELDMATTTVSTASEVSAAPLVIDEIPTWTVLRSEVLVEVEPSADLIFEIPQFDGPYEQANIAITEWMMEQTDWWVEGLAEFPPVDNGDPAAVGGTYELYFQATLESPGLAAFRWNYYEYVCCRAYPNHGNKAVVVDLRAGRILPVSEILDLDRLEEIHAVWADHVDPEIVPPSAFEIFDDRPGFTSVALTPNGVELGTDRSGPFPGATTVIPFAALGDLVDERLAEQAQLGSTPTSS